MSQHDTDVAILGGGLAGLTLALQLRRRDPSLRVTVIERHAHPVREGAFKVGESSVEIGAHYFAHVLGLREHLETEHIRKFGFRFFFSDGAETIDDCTELGVSRLLPTPSWQIDRGRFENHLTTCVRDAGATLFDGAVVRGIDMAEGDSAHRVRIEANGESTELTARWLVDASGRAGLLKRKLGLAEANAHNANSVWWRVSGHLDPNDWSDDEAWQTRCGDGRWRSTNHMCGDGYWFWLIPLSSNQHSLGIVCDGDVHPLETMNTHEKAMAWLRRHQPRVATALAREDHALQDFMFLRHFSHGAKQVFSGDGRWALTGEAGVFLDPFYSPGSDFIALSNTYICELIDADRRGEPVTGAAALYQQLYFSFYANTLTLYQDQYRLFGDAQVMPLKVIWDYTYYWALLAPLFFAGHQARLPVLGALRETFASASALNIAMQALLRDWGARNAARGDALQPRDMRLLDQSTIPWFRELNAQLEQAIDEPGFIARAQRDVELMHALAAELLDRARGEHPGIADHGLSALLGERRAPATPLLGDAWYARHEAAQAA